MVPEMKKKKKEKGGKNGDRERKRTSGEGLVTVKVWEDGFCTPPFILLH